MIIDIASAAIGEAPAAIAPTPHTTPNGTMPISIGDMSRTPSRNAEREKCARMRNEGPAAGKPQAHDVRGDYNPAIQPLIPPAVKPPTTRSWNTAIRIEIGTIATISAADISGHGKAYSPW